ncbi:MAG TPA: cytochrome c [Acetobacteraceae bacterium]|nr:cytochrome c [Acetobacteraceae bacterium]HQU01026.1 cytochrome c [Acetobacteraceae bacterium]
MNMRPSAIAIGVGLCLTASPFPSPLQSARAAQTGAALFADQCGTCHTLSAKDPVRQGPPLGDVYGRKVGSVKDFPYSPDFTKANFVWDSKTLDAYLTNPSAMFADSYMSYQQPDPTIRAQVIEYLKQQAPLYAKAGQ